MAKPEKRQKRAELPKQCAQTSEFKKSWERYKRAGRRDMNEVRQVMVMLFLGELLPVQYLDHALSGDWIGFRECHIGGDFLMTYEHSRADLIIFVDIGSHSELFK
ncbi:type II toxin-antitoxin system YafQ family toxin [Pseudomonas sp. SWRI74]|uniref:Type II toxin-antitoxin system YafQ family toxin n=1 Tax=Pseudomonas azerbaijanoccidentalis TaxID=2842347 RepID=A0ABS6QWU4_9PSED|nr:type II toxin-antitoxin system YafQ family toxin [Pseudomonas azerbaijanoccidentalis]MBV4523397.1 type II toxin-antitoxin system YafQ family toxin [Pseudomonas azerbaijanoccidentalis]